MKNKFVPCACSILVATGLHCLGKLGECFAKIRHVAFTIRVVRVFPGHTYEYRKQRKGCNLSNWLIKKNN